MCQPFGIPKLLPVNSLPFRRYHFSRGHHFHVAELPLRLFHTSDWHLGQNLHGQDRDFEHGCFLDCSNRMCC
jgi:hypothetical protein